MIMLYAAGYINVKIDVENHNGFVKAKENISIQRNTITI